MNTSSRFIVALHILTYIAARIVAFGKEATGLIRSDELAMSVNTNPVFIRRLVAQMGSAGLIHAERGRNGGITLAKAPGQITLLDIYDAVEKGSIFQMHYNDPSAHCAVGSNIQDCVCGIFTEAEDAMRAVLGKRNLEEIAKEIIELSGVKQMIEAGKSFDEIRAIMLERAGMQLPGIS